jgi:hypothetical protein
MTTTPRLRDKGPFTLPLHFVPIFARKISFFIIENLDRCDDFKKYFRAKFGEKITIFWLKLMLFLQKSDHNFGFLEKRYIVP